MSYPGNPSSNEPIQPGQVGSENSGQLPPYGAYHPPHGAPRPQNRRPGTVTAASWITIVMSGLTIILGILGIFGSSSWVDYMVDHPSQFELTREEVQNSDDIKIGLIFISALLIFFSIAAIAMAICVLKRQQWARILLTILTGLTILASAIASLVLIGIPWLVVSIVVVVLLFAGGANAWFSPPIQPAQYPSQQYPVQQYPGDSNQPPGQ